MQLEERATATASLIVSEPELLPIERLTQEHANGCFGVDVEMRSSGNTHRKSMCLTEMSADKQAGEKEETDKGKQPAAQKKKTCTTRQPTQTHPSFLADLQALNECKFKMMEKVHHLFFGKVQHLCFPIQPRWGFHFDIEEFHEREVGVRKSNEKRAKDLATLLPKQDRNVRSRGAKPTHKGGGPIKQPGGGFRGN